MEDNIKSMSPLVWAYIGDAVFSLYIREKVLNGINNKINTLHIKTSKIVNAKKQAEIYKQLEEFFTEEEKNIGRRARNTKNYHIPKNTTVAEYSMSTALEAVIGYVYLSKDNNRLEEIMEEIYKYI